MVSHPTLIVDIASEFTFIFYLYKYEYRRTAHVSFTETLFSSGFPILYPVLISKKESSYIPTIAHYNKRNITSLPSHGNSIFLVHKLHVLEFEAEYGIPQINYIKPVN